MFSALIRRAAATIESVLGAARKPAKKSSRTGTCEVAAACCGALMSVDWQFPCLCSHCTYCDVMTVLFPGSIVVVVSSALLVIMYVA